MRTARSSAAALAVVVAVVAVLVGAEEPAEAAVLTETFNQLTCNGVIHNIGSDSTELFVSCQTSVATWNGFDSGSVLDFGVRDVYQAPAITNWISGGIGPADHTAQNDCTAVVGTYRLRCHRTFSGAGIAYAAAPQAYVTGSWGTPRAGRSARWDVVVMGTDYPDYPVDYYPGGTAGGPPVTAIDVPAYSCEREYDPATGVVSLSATGPSGLPAGALSGAVVSEGWSVPWIDDGEPFVDGAATTPKVATLTVPTTKPAGGWLLRFEARVQVTSPAYSFTPSAVDAVGMYAPYLTNAVRWGFFDTSNTYEGVAVTDIYQRDGATLTVRLPDSRYGGTPDEGHLLQVRESVPASEGEGLVYGYWPRLSAEPERSPWVLIGRTLGTTLELPQQGLAGTLFRYPVAGGYYEETTTTTAVVGCQVLLDVTRPAAGASGSTGGGTAPAVGQPTSGVGDECAYDGWGSGTPVLRSVLTVLNVVRSLSCLLRALFVPDDLDWGSLTDGLEDEFPLSLAVGLGAAATTGLTWAGEQVIAGDPCAGLDFSAALQHITSRDDVEVAFRFPTPVESACPGMGGGARTTLDDQVGGLFGYRLWVRALMLLLLWVGLARRLLGAWADGGAEAEQMVS